jgi:hypothetical protein
MGGLCGAIKYEVLILNDVCEKILVPKIPTHKSNPVPDGPEVGDSCVKVGFQGVKHGDLSSFLLENSSD